MVEAEMDEEEFQFFAGMPDELVEGVVERLDLGSRLSFRKTCRECRKCVDESRFFIEFLTVMQNENPGFHIWSNDQFNIYWDKEEEVSRVKVGGRILDVSGKDIYRMFQKMLSLIFFSNPRLVIGQLNLENIESGPEGALDPHIPVLPGSLKVKKLKTINVSKENVLEWITLCNQKTMQELILQWFPINQQGSPEVRIKNIEYDCEQLFQPSNWKEFKEKWNDHNCFWMRRLGFSCVTSAAVCFEEEMSPSAEQILDLKDVLLKNTKLIKIKLFGIKNSDFKAISELIGTYNLRTERNPTFVYYEYPESDMKLAMCVTERKIVFRGPCWVEEEDVNNFAFEEVEEEEALDDARAEAAFRAEVARRVRQMAIAIAMAVQDGERNFAEDARRLLGENVDAAPYHAVPQNIRDAPAAPVADLVEQVNVDPMADQVPGALQAVVEAVAATAVQAESEALDSFGVRLNIQQ